MSGEGLPRRVALGTASVAFTALAALAHADGITTQQADQLIKQNAEILEQLRDIRQLLGRQAAVPSAAAPAPDERVRHALAATTGFSMGRSDAPLTLVEYTDYQCPFCRQFHIAAFQEIKRNYIDTGKLRYISRDFPLDMHENAPQAAQAARCAADQGRFWDLRHVMIVNANQLQRQNLMTYAADLKLDVDAFAACLTGDRHRVEIERELAEGRDMGVSATPTFVLGTVRDGQMDGVRIVGALPYATFDAKLKALLAREPEH